MTPLLLFVFISSSLLATVVRGDTNNGALDLSFYRKGAAIGDSYAAGIGAGNKISGPLCARYDGSYSNLVALQLDSPSLDFTFTACSGAVIKDVRKQAAKLSSGQEFVIVSSGGNDAKLVDILNDCVYNWWGVFSGNCDKTLDRSEGLIKGSGLSDGAAGLIADIKTKLAPGGRIYYVGYAKFFDTSDSACDKVSWHIWINLFTRQYLTKARRTRMNQLTEAMNKALEDTVTRVGGDQVDFINYDDYVGLVGGRYCQPSVDENRSRGANRDTLFFYEIQSDDPAWIDRNAPLHDELRRRGDDSDEAPEAGSLASQIGALIMLSVNTSKATVNAVDNANVNNDLLAEVDEVDGANQAKVRRETGDFERSNPLEIAGDHFGERHLDSRSASRLDVSNSAQQSASGFRSSSSRQGIGAHPHSSSSSTGKGNLAVSTPSSQASRLRVAHLSSASTILRKTSGSVPSYPAASGTVIPQYPTSSNDSLGLNIRIPGLGVLVGSSELGGLVHLQPMASGNLSFTQSKVASIADGTVIGNTTHLIMSDLKIVQKLSITSLLVSDKTLRVFHPTQYGHAIIANAIMYRMTKNRAKSLGIEKFPPVAASTMGEGWLEPKGTACQRDGTSTWANRDVMIDALDQFCSDPHNMAAKQGATSSDLYNRETLNRINVSISWDGTGNLGEHGCKSWMRAVTDGCDVPGSDGIANPDNWKHGGSIQYRNSVTSATLNITPLSVRRMFDGGKRTSGQSCNSNDSQYYMDQQTLHNNIEDYCKALADKKIGQDGDVFTKTYNEGTPDRVELKTAWPSGPKNFQIHREECMHYMSALNDGCNVPDVKQQINPMNWKHGGSFADNNNVLYSITPKYKRAPPPSSPKAGCGTRWKLTHFDVDFSGGGWNGLTNSDYGRSAVLPSFKRCGATTAWTFDYFDEPDENGHEWRAHITLPIFISKGCAGNAIEWAGGPSMYC